MYNAIRSVVRQHVLKALVQGQDKEITLAFNLSMQCNPGETVSYVQDLISCAVPARARRILFCPSTDIYEYGQVLRENRIGCGIQNIHDAQSGAYTGEVSARQALSAGASHALLGASYRRLYFNEDNAFIARKFKAALSCALTPVLCVGETLEQHRQTLFSKVVGEQVLSALHGVNLKRGDAAVAYEPVWAVERGRAADPKQINEALLHIRNLLAGRYGEAIAEGIPVLLAYDLPAAQIMEYAVQPGLDGFLLSAGVHGRGYMQEVLSWFAAGDDH